MKSSNSSLEAVQSYRPRSRSSASDKKSSRPINMPTRGYDSSTLPVTRSQTMSAADRSHRLVQQSHTGSFCVISIDFPETFQPSWNRRFPRSMHSQGERPGCGSHVKRVDHGDAFNASRYVKKRSRFIISCSNLICHGASGPKWAKLKEYFSIFNVIVTE